jgi:hypothetical protein
VRIARIKANILMVIALALCVLQGGLWARSADHFRSQSDESNRVVQHSPTEIPGVAGLALLVYAGLMISYPLASDRE